MCATTSAERKERIKFVTEGKARGILEVHFSTIRSELDTGFITVL